MLAYLSEETSNLDVADIVKMLDSLTPSSNLSLDIRQVRVAYTILRYTPIEYLPKSVRVDLTKRAVVFDAQSITVPKSRLAHSDFMNVLSLSREYISRSIAHTPVFDRQVLYHPPIKI